MGRVIALFVTLAGALIWALSSVTPPSIDVAGGGVPAAYGDLAAIARAPHPTGSAENARVRAYLATRMRTLGAEVSEQSFPLPAKALERLGKWSGRLDKGIAGHNVIGVLPGRDRTKPALMLMAHHDSVWASPGAGDDAMAIAAILEVTRSLRARGQAQRDVILLFTDAEEIGLDGAKAFFDKHPFARRIGMIINLEARGAGGRANMFETGHGNGEQMRLYAETVQRPAANSLAVLIYDMMPNSTDYTIAKERGIAGYNFAVLDRAWTYHSPLATPQAVDLASVQDMEKQVLALASALAFAPELPARTPNAAFADVLGQVTIVYPAGVGWAILLVAAGLIGVALWRRRTGVRAIGQGMILTVALLLHGGLLLTAFNAVSGSGGANYYDRLAAIPRLEAMAALLTAALLMLMHHLRRSENRLIAVMVAMALMWAGLLTGGPLGVTVVLAVAAMGLSWFLPARSMPGSDEPDSSPLPFRGGVGGGGSPPPDDGLGETRGPHPNPAPEGEGQSVAVVLLLFFASVIVQALLPTAGPLLQWPLLLAGASMAARAFLPARAALIIATAAATIGLGHLLTQAHFIFLAVGAPMPGLLMVLLFAALPLLLPLWPDRIPRWLPGAALAAALVIALWVRLDPMAPSVPEYSLKSPAKTKD